MAFIQSLLATSLSPVSQVFTQESGDYGRQRFARHPRRFVPLAQCLAFSNPHTRACNSCELSLL